MASRFFESQAIFKTSVPNDLKMTTNTKRSQVSNIDITTNSESQISLRFALRLANFELEANSRQVHRMTQKLHGALKDQN